MDKKRKNSIGNKYFLEDLKIISNGIRKDVLKMINLAGSGHTASSLGLADIFTYIYFSFANIDFKKKSTRDFVIVSNGHIAPLVYAILSKKDFFPRNKLFTLRELGSPLQGHPHYNLLPGIENSGGPLGQGISQAVGLASSLKRDGKNNRVICTLGDGELAEGQCWEAFLYASKERLDNLFIVVDNNNIQIDGYVSEISNFNNLHRKLSSFGLFVIEFDGNNFHQIDKAFKSGLKVKDKPICLLARTISGKGVSFMEGDYNWHGRAPNDEELKLALEELK